VFFSYVLRKGFLAGYACARSVSVVFFMVGQVFGWVSQPKNDSGQRKKNDTDKRKKSIAAKKDFLNQN